MLTPDVMGVLQSLPDEVKNVYIFGVESHVCVLQTTLDLLRRGYNVYLVSDAIASQRENDRAVALQRMERAGAILTTGESALYEILQDAQHPRFKACLKHVKALAHHFSTLSLQPIP